MSFRLRVDGDVFRDSTNRQVILRGINVSGDSKLPRDPEIPSHVADHFFDGDNVSFVGRPFSVDEAPKHLKRLRRWGYNTLRYLFTWEALEAAGPGKYDEAYIEHSIAVLRCAKTLGFYVFMDPHQDVWSRFTGGSGAPMWTVYACGLDPRAFQQTEAALVQNTWPDPDKFPKMIWATNYNRLACQTIMTMFFAGKQFAPKAIIDGVNIQDYLQDHFIAACTHFAQRIKEAGDLENNVVIGWESINEPNKALLGIPDLSVVPKDQVLQLGTSPTAWQAILTGSGRACQVETWGFGRMGPYKSGSVLVDPKGQSAWLPSDYDDKQYGWKRDPGWKLGECIWAQHGLWDPRSDKLLKKDYFAKDPATGQRVDHPYFTNNYLMAHYKNYSAAIRSISPNTIMFCQPPVNELPPMLKGTENDDPNMVYSPHWYDGVTLMNKKWNRWWNVDVFGVLRGKYLSPVFAIKIGETAIRNCFRDTLCAIRQEGMENMGRRPYFLGETGVPYDMDDKYAYKTGDYTSQIQAMDAVHYALEGSNANYAIWVYTANNDHERGDQWDGEDLSIYSRDDKVLPNHPPPRSDGSDTFDRVSPSYSESRLSEDSDDSLSHAKQPMIVRTRTDRSMAGAKVAGSFRAAEAFVRPCPVAIAGTLISYSFDLAKCEFKLSFAAKSTVVSAPTRIYLPSYHFPKSETEVNFSGGKWTISEENLSGVPVQYLKWWHIDGEQNITIKGVVRQQAVSRNSSGIAAFFNQCREMGCLLM